MKKLNRYIYKRKVAKLLQNPIREKRFIDYTRAKSILLLFESDSREENRYIHKLIEELVSDGKKVNAIGFLDIKQIKTTNLPNFNILDRQNINFVKQPKEIFLQHLMRTEYDILIDLTTNEVLPLQYICLYAKAFVKVGTNSAMENVLDLVITVNHQREIENNNNQVKKSEDKTFDEKQQYLCEKILFYLNKIKSKKV